MINGVMVPQRRGGATQGKAPMSQFEALRSWRYAKGQPTAAQAARQLPSGGIEVGLEVLRRPRGRHAASARRRWLAFALSRCCSSSFRFSRLRPTHAEALAGTVGALAATVGALAAMAALPDAAGEWASRRAAEAWGCSLLRRGALWRGGRWG